MRYEVEVDGVTTADERPWLLHWYTQAGFATVAAAAGLTVTTILAADGSPADPEAQAFAFVLASATARWSPPTRSQCEGLIDLSYDYLYESWMPVTGPDLPISQLKAELFRALANPGRIRILETLVDGERSVGDLQPRVGLELSHLSQQLGVLRRADLVAARKEGALVFYSIKQPLLPDLLAIAKQLLIMSLTETQHLLADLHQTDSR